jgi:hypothetical protein
MSESGFNWFERIIGSLTFWAIAGNVLVVLFEMVPFFGIILAALLAGTRIAFLMPHMIIVCLVADIFARRLHPVLLVVPLFLYGGYYAAYFNQQTQVDAYAAQMRNKNPAHIMQYDPAAHSLVYVDNRDEARELLKGYKVPATYYRGRYSVPKVFRTMSYGLCEDLKTAGVYKPPLGGDEPRCDFINYYDPDKKGVVIKTARIFEWFEKPVKRPIDISIEGEGAKWTSGKPALDLNIVEKIYVFSDQGREAGRFVTATYNPLPVVPAWAYICTAWEQLTCGGEFYSGGRKDIDTFPANVDRDNPVASLLGIAPYAGKDMTDFQPFAETEAIGRDLVARKKNETPDDFNKWGIRKDDPRLPVINTLDGVPSYKGGIYTYQLGGSFYDFIKENEGRIVYVDGTLDGGNGNPSNSGFGLYGICPKREKCGSVDHRYVFTEGNGSVWDRANYTVKGYWQVGPPKPNGEDTTTDLSGVAAPQ